MIHELKCWPRPFHYLQSLTKTFEFRKNDREYKIGDALHLREFDPATEKYSGDTAWRRVTYILYGGVYGLPSDYVVMSVVPCCPEIKS